MRATRSFGLSLLGAMALALSVAGCDSANDAESQAAAEPQPEATAVSDTVEATATNVPALDANNCAPAGDLRGDPENGKALHMEHCVACHGLTGAADVVVMHMDETPPDQSDPEYMRNLPDSYLYLAICRGGEGVGKSYVMSPWGDFFTDREIKDLIAWVRTFSGT